jgi:hypothetical protein
VHRPELSITARIILSMRRWLVIFLIVLLPWRAWAGDAMTLAMGAPAGIQGHCAEHTLGAAMSHGEHATAADNDNQPSPHTACDICNGPAMTATTHPGVDTGPLPQARQTDGPVRFASALPRPGHKPPIS